MPTQTAKPKSPAKLGAEKLTPEEHIELTRSGAERRHAELKRRRVVTGIDVAFSPTQRLTVDVTSLDPATRREVAEALSDTPWVPELVEAGAKPEPKPAAPNVRRMSTRARLARLGS